MMTPRQARLYQSLREFSIDETEVALPFEQRLADENGWSVEFARDVVEEYKKFVFLTVVAEHPVTPSDPVDQAWHLHLTYSRSYWDRLCGEVLQRPLHHDPTEGGSRERDKFVGQYQRTLEVYRRFFGAEPGAVWETVEERFSRRQFQRVDVAAAWLVPKRAARRWLWLAPVLIAVLVAGVGCVPLFASGDGGFGCFVFVALGFFVLLVLASQMSSNKRRGRGGRSRSSSDGGGGGWFLGGFFDGGDGDSGGDGGDSGCGGGGCGGGGCGGGD